MCAPPAAAAGALLALSAACFLAAAARVWRAHDAAHATPPPPLPSHAAPGLWGPQQPAAATLDAQQGAAPLHRACLAVRADGSSAHNLENAVSLPSLALAFVVSLKNIESLILLLPAPTPQAPWVATPLALLAYALGLRPRALPLPTVLAWAEVATAAAARAARRTAAAARAEADASRARAAEAGARDAAALCQSVRHGFFLSCGAAVSRTPFQSHRRCLFRLVSFSRQHTLSPIR